MFGEDTRQQDWRENGRGSRGAKRRETLKDRETSGQRQRVEEPPRPYRRQNTESRTKATGDRNAAQKDEKGRRRHAQGRGRGRKGERDVSSGGPNGTDPSGDGPTAPRALSSRSPAGT